MPLKEGSSQKVVSANISELHKGPRYAATRAKHGAEAANKQAIAIALKTARESRRAMGGRIRLKVGGIHSNVPGRTDKHPMRVQSGSYVLPADTVSHLGDGNTMAGMEKAQAIFGKSYVRAKGGAVPIIAAGGEFVISPHGALSWFHKQGGRGGLKQAHEALDQWVMEQREKNVETLAGLPPPAQD